MTIVEALKALREGKKVRNKIWEEHEYIMLKNGFIKYGNGVTHRIDIYGEYDMCDDTWEEYKEEVLDEKEKEYLSAVIKPFRDKVESITKNSIVTVTTNERGMITNTCVSEFISIRTKNETGIPCTINLPYFSRGDMYRAMINDKNYTLEELGL